MIQNSFVGTWRLVSYEVKTEDGKVNYPFGRDAVGYIIYTREGYMSVVIMYANRPRVAANNLRGASVEQKAAAAETYQSYCGRYEVKGDKVIHQVKVSLFPNWASTAQERNFKFDGDRLILKPIPAPAPPGASQQVSELTWERVKD